MAPANAAHIQNSANRHKGERLMLY